MFLRAFFIIIKYYYYKSSYGVSFGDYEILAIINKKKKQKKNCSCVHHDVRFLDFLGIILYSPGDPYNLKNKRNLRKHKVP